MFTAPHMVAVRPMIDSIIRTAIGTGLTAVVAAGCVGGVSPSSPPSAPIAGPSGEPDLLVYFLDQTRYATAVPPYEVMVRRPASGASSADERALATVRAMLAGPTSEERGQGLSEVTSGFTDVRDVRLIDAVAHVYLEGTCRGGGATYTVSNLISANLLPFPEIEWVKVYDERGETEEPTGPRDSIPLCLEP